LGIECLNAVGGKNFPLKDTVLLKYQGTQTIMAETVEEISTHYGGTEFLYFDQEKDGEGIWNLRKNVFPHLGRRYKGLVTDVW
jgi:hypothetical protein